MHVKRKCMGKKKRHSGKGLVNKIINSLPVELHIPGYQYCGPACKEHDIAYLKNRENLEHRGAADRIPADKAWKPVFAKDASIGEKAAAWSVANIMNAKSKLGMGITKKKKKPKKKITLRKVIEAAKRSMTQSNDAQAVIQSVLKGAQTVVNQAGGKKNIRAPRVLPVPSKVGGLLPFLVPMFAGLSAAGVLAGGKGLYLKPYKKGLGIHLKPKNLK
ncbi:uncharacterized protein LOC112494698 [Cephus cinctus]|uniref:Uncharacterized protein LOC112494698 n=1 Tax=Cephus cinctus TaxID=211228 RepID=A0AAJ7RLV7_CEPCN|nr:uncharacterized protein LOC112494698 [Cephus cinctus]